MSYGLVVCVCCIMVIIVIVYCWLISVNWLIYLLVDSNIDKAFCYRLVGWLIDWENICPQTTLVLESVKIRALL